MFNNDNLVLAGLILGCFLAFILASQLSLIAAKLLGAIAWSWWLIFLPSLTTIALGSLLISLWAIASLITSFYD